MMFFLPQEQNTFTSVTGGAMSINANSSQNCRVFCSDKVMFLSKLRTQILAWHPPVVLTLGKLISYPKDFSSIKWG